VSGSLDAMARVWDVTSGEIFLGPIETGREVYVMTYSPDGMRIAMGGYHNGVEIWDSATGELLSTIKLANSV